MHSHYKNVSLLISFQLKALLFAYHFKSRLSAMFRRFLVSFLHRFLKYWDFLLFWLNAAVRKHNITSTSTFTISVLYIYYVSHIKDMACWINKVFRKSFYSDFTSLRLDLRCLLNIVPKVDPCTYPYFLPVRISCDPDREPRWYITNDQQAISFAWVFCSCQIDVS